MDVLSVVLGVGTLLGGLTTLFLWLEARGEKSRQKRRDEIDQQITAVLAPIRQDLQALHAKLDSDSEHSAVVLKAAIQEALEPLKDQISTHNTKIEPLWKALEAMAVAQVQVLHQPDPARAEIDGLLEELHDELDGGTLMPAGNYQRLQHFLTLIKTWEPGVTLDFPVLPGEPTSAGILLSIMGLNRERRRQEQKKP